MCIKLTNEPPEGLKPNLLKAMIPFTDEFFEGCSKPGELRSAVPPTFPLPPTSSPRAPNAEIAACRSNRAPRVVGKQVAGRLTKSDTRRARGAGRWCS